MLSQEAEGLREDRLLALLHRLLALPTHDVHATLAHTTHLLAELLPADTVHAYLHDAATAALVPLDVFDLPPEPPPAASALPPVPLAQGGPLVEVFVSAQFVRPFIAGGTSSGLGLRLYLARRIAEAHYGTLAVESPAGQGVRVTLGLPVQEEDFNMSNHYEESGLIG